MTTTRTLLTPLVVAAMLAAASVPAALPSMATGGAAFGQSVKKDKRPLLQEYAIHGTGLANKAKAPAGSFKARQGKQRLLPSAGCPQCTIKKD